MIVIRYSPEFKIEKLKKGCNILLRLNSHDSDYTKVFLTKAQIKFLNLVICNFKKDIKKKGDKKADF